MIGESVAPATLQHALGLAPAPFDRALRCVQLLARHTADALALAFGQPVQIGPATVRQTEPGEVEREDWEVYYPVDVHWHVGGTTYPALLLLPKSELQTLLPAAHGADLPDMAALSRLLRAIVAHVTAEGERAFSPAIRVSLPDAGAAQPSEQDAPLRAEHQVRIGSSGTETVLTLVHLIPATALTAVAECTVCQAAVAANAGCARPARQPYASTAGAHGGRATPDGIPAGTPAAGRLRTVRPGGPTGQAVALRPLADLLEATRPANVGPLHDVTLRVSAELGRILVPMSDLLAWGPGSVIQLETLDGEPVDILVDDQVIAKGEVVVVDRHFGVRVTEILSRSFHRQEPSSCRPGR